MGRYGVAPPRWRSFAVVKISNLRIMDCPKRHWSGVFPWDSGTVGADGYLIDMGLSIFGINGETRRILWKHKYKKEFRSI